MQRLTSVSFFCSLVPTVVLSTGCVDSSAPEIDEQSETGQDDALSVSVSVDIDELIREVPPQAFGIHTSVYDNALHDSRLPAQLEEAGIELLRYPGGGYSDNYHWSTHSMTAWADGSRGYLARGSDFGSYLGLVERTGTSLMITVNYGSNLAGDGPGEPKEAAAWVAYANGDPDDDTPIGKDGSDNDWRTVGYWATLRASEPKGDDDGYNFLRIAHPDPIGVEYWEVGNEVFGNGYYAGDDDYGFELDLHVPYDGTSRGGNANLSPTRYGEGVLDYAEAMKGVDPNIKVGAVLNTPPADLFWGPDWNDDVLSKCGEVIDFGVVHWYPNADDLVAAPSRIIPRMFEMLHESFTEHAGNSAPDLEVAVTELGPNVASSSNSLLLSGLFAADAYVTFIEQGASNIDWLELHNGSFLSEASAALGRAYHGIQLAHIFATPGDELLQTESDLPAALIAHAARRDDGRLAVMLLNADPGRDAQVTVDGLELDVNSEVEVFRYEPAGAGGVEGPSNLTLENDVLEVEVPPRTLALAVVVVSS